MISKHTVTAEVPVDPYLVDVPIATAVPHVAESVEGSPVSGLIVGALHVVRATLTTLPGQAVTCFMGADTGGGSPVTVIPDGDRVPLEWTFVPTTSDASIFTECFGGNLAQVPGGVSVYRRDTRYSLPLHVTDATVTLDETWSPYAQVSLACRLPAPDVLRQIDPRSGVRARVRLEQRFGESEPLATLSAAFAGLTLAALSTAYAGRLVASLSADYGLGYNDGVGMRSSTRRPMDLVVAARDVDVAADTMTLTLGSDELLAQSAGLVADAALTTSSTSLRAAVTAGLRRIDAALSSSADDVTDLDVDALTWPPGMSVWDWLAPLVLAGERRLWCDEKRAWHLGLPEQLVDGEARLTPIATGLSESLNVNDWFDAVLVEYRWTDASGVDHVRYETAGDTLAQRVYHVTRERRPWPRSGAARALLRYVSAQGRQVRVQAVSDYSVTPGQAVNVTLPDGVHATGVVSSVTWALPADEMTVTVRDLAEAPVNSWLADAPGVAWTDLPVGTDWTEDV